MTATVNGELVAPKASRPVPWTVWALLVGALGQLTVQLLPDSYSVFGPYFLVDGNMVVAWIRAVAPFVLAASVIAGADRWPEGRRLLHAGAAALAVFAVLSFIHTAWWAIWETNPGPIPEDQELWLMARALGAGVANLAAYALIAVGLWVAGRPRPIRGLRLLTIAGIGALAIVGTAIGLWTLTLYRWGDGGALTAVATVATGVLTPLSFTALGAVGMAAIRAMPARTPVPEVLIAAGVTLAVAGLAWMWSLWGVIPPQDLSFEAAEFLSFLPNLAIGIGLVAMVGGFAAGWIAAGSTTAEGSRALS